MADGPHFADVYRDEVWRVYAYVAYRVATRQDAEDLTQQVFERALRAWPRFDPARASPATWLLAIARNLLVDRHRAGAHRHEVEIGEVPEARLPSAEAPGVPGLAPELARALAALSAREREILGLRFGADLDGPQIAALTGLSLANVQQILSRSLRRLRELLGGESGGQREEPRAGAEAPAG